MVFREIKLGEVVVFGLNVRAFSDGKTHIGEDRGQLVNHLRDRMHATDLERRFAYRQRDVEAFAVEPRFQSGALERFAPRRKGSVDPVFQSVDQRSLTLALFRSHCAECFQ